MSLGTQVCVARVARFAASVLTALLIVSGAAIAQQRPYQAALSISQIQGQGQESRQYGYYIPSTYSPTRASPLIVALHGRFSSPAAFDAMSGLREVAERQGAVLIYPAAAGNYWNDGGHEALNRLETARDDVGFVAAAIASAKRTYSIDAARVFVVGYDLGGNLAISLACNSAEPIAGVAVVSALMWDYSRRSCVPPHRVPILFVMGERDWYFPTNGAGPTEFAPATRLSLAETETFWRGVNGCRAAPQRRGISRYSGDCAEGSAVATVLVRNGEHDWFRDREGYQLNRQGLSAARMSEDFFFRRTEFSPERRNAASNRSRSWITYAPPQYTPEAPTPLVIVLHGRPSTANGMAQITQMNAVADRHGFLVVYPDGINLEWNAFFDLTGHRASVPQDDEAFLRRLVGDVEQDFNVDRRRVYVAGFSNGGFMTIRLACTSSDAFAAFASVGAQLYSILTNRCRGRPAPIMFIHGTADRSVFYTGVEQRDGQTGESTRISLSTQDTVAYFARRNGCSLRGEQTNFAESGRSPGTSVVRFVPAGCRAGAPVQFFIVNGGGHNWPGVTGVLDEHEFGPTNLDFNAGEVIWQFFEQQTLDQQ